MDNAGYHAAICRKGPSIVHRHDSIRDVIAEFCRQAAWSPRTEVPNLLPSDKDENLRPADILLPRGEKGIPIALDVTVVHPFAKKYKDKSQTGIDQTNILAEKQKNGKYFEKCKFANIHFIPITIEYFGRLGPSALRFLDKLSAGIANRMNTKLDRVRKEIQRKIAFTLLRCNARAIFIRTLSPD